MCHSSEPTKIVLQQPITMRIFHLRIFALLISVTPLVKTSARAESDRGREWARVTFYEDSGFRGESVTLRTGESLENLSKDRFRNGVRINDRITSIRIEGNAAVFVYRDAGFRGDALRLTNSVRNLDDFAPGWNDRISSIRVERIRGGRPDRPGRMDVERVDHVIQRAYRDILRRDPDESGLHSFREHMFDDGWDEEQVRQALWRSDEYRLVVERLVAKAYRDLLGREPDEGGGRMFRDRMLRDHWTEEDLRDAIRNSDEYRKRPHPPRKG